MATVLHLDASARVTRSISRELSQSFVTNWLRLRPADRVIRRDLAADPPPFVTEAWIAACFTPSAGRNDGMREVLAWSDAAIAEIAAADVIAIGTPMYNYGMPAMLKAWFDQVIRIGQTFSFDLDRGDWPLEPMFAGKTLVVLSARGEFGFEPGGARADRNYLDGHIATCAHYLGVAREDVHDVCVEYQEFGDVRHKRSRTAADVQVVALADTLAKRHGFVS